MLGLLLRLFKLKEVCYITKFHLLFLNKNFIHDVIYIQEGFIPYCHSKNWSCLYSSKMNTGPPVLYIMYKLIIGVIFNLYH